MRILYKKSLKSNMNKSKIVNYYYRLRQNIINRYYKRKRKNTTE